MKIKIIILLTAALCLVNSAAAQKSKNLGLQTDRMSAVEKVLTANEQAVWKGLVDKKYDDFGKTLTDDYQGVYDNEITNKAAELTEAKSIDFKSAAVNDIKVKILDENNAIVTATVKSEVVDQAGKEYTDNFRTTSIWVKRGNAWLVVYHSDIIIKQ